MKERRRAMKTNEAEPLYPTGAAADYLTLKAQTLRAKRSRGDGPPYVVLSHSRIAYRKSDLDAWIAGRVATNTADAKSRGLTDPGPGRAA
jgi:Helix-turn-helix domain